MASSGERIGAFEWLNVSHIRPIVRTKTGYTIPDFDNRPATEGTNPHSEEREAIVCGVMKVYAGEGNDEYETLISKEALDSFRAYLELRIRAGEKVTDDSAAIVTRDMKRWCLPGTIKNSINLLLWEVAIRKKKMKRHEFQVDHGFRKFHDSVAKDYMSEEYVEKLMGHDTGTKEHYDRHIPKPAIDQYLRAIPHLTIDMQARDAAFAAIKLEEKQHRIERLETETTAEVDHLRVENLTLGKKVDSLEARLSEIQQLLKRLVGVETELERRNESS